MFQFGIQLFYHILSTCLLSIHFPGMKGFLNSWDRWGQIFYEEAAWMRERSQKVRWQLVWKPRASSGLGIKSLLHKNLALLSKLMVVTIWSCQDQQPCRCLSLPRKLKNDRINSSPSYLPSNWTPFPLDIGKPEAPKRNSKYPKTHALVLACWFFVWFVVVNYLCWFFFFFFLVTYFWLGLFWWLIFFYNFKSF